MNDYITRFIEIYEKSGILKASMLNIFFSNLTENKPGTYNGIITCAEKANDEINRPLNEQIDTLEEKRISLTRECTKLELIK